jgi:hypothetical protein
VARVLAYIHQSQVILRFRDDPERKLVAFPDTVVLNVDGDWPLLTQEPPQLDSQVLVLKELYGCMMGLVVVCNAAQLLGYQTRGRKRGGYPQQRWCDPGHGYAGWFVDGI